MSSVRIAAAPGTITLPHDAPVVQLSTGYGPVGAKTWALKRPVTIVGSRRPAHIVVHHHAVSEAHCAIVNTGRHVVLLDLNTAGGTRVGGRPVQIAGLKDGDVVTIGDTALAVRLEGGGVAAPTPAGALRRARQKSVADAALVAPELTLRDGAAGGIWRLCQPAGLIGRRAGAAVRIDAPRLADAHALLAWCAGEWLILDLTGRAGVLVNDWPVREGTVRPGDRCRLGGLTLTIGMDAAGSGSSRQMSEDADAAAAQPVPPQDPLVGLPRPAAPDVVPRSPFSTRSQPQLGSGSTPSRSQLGSGSTPSRSQLGCGSTPLRSWLGSDASLGAGECESLRRDDPRLVELRAALIRLKDEMDRAWLRLNKWRLEGAEKDARLIDSHADLSRRIAEMDARDAAMRGLLHDLGQYHEILEQCRVRMLDVVEGPLR